MLHFLLGLLVGVILGLFVACLLVAGRDSDRNSIETHEYTMAHLMATRDRWEDN